MPNRKVAGFAFIAGNCDTIATSGIDLEHTIVKCEDGSTGHFLYDGIIFNFDHSRGTLVNSITQEEIIWKSDNLNGWGVKRPGSLGCPVYYTIGDNGSLFCSSHIHLLRALGKTIEEDTKRLPEYLVFRYISPPNTLYKNIFIIPILNSLTINFSAAGELMFSLASCPLPNTREEPTENELKRDAYFEMRQFVTSLSCMRSRCLVPLSGGLDSSVLYLMCKNELAITNTISTGFPFEAEEDNVEKQYALSAAESLDTIHEYLQFSMKEFYIAFIEAIAHAEEPLHHFQSILMELLCSSSATGERDIVICGEGADAVFGGSRRGLQHLQKMNRLVDLPMLRPVLSSDFSSSLIGKLFNNATLEDSIDRILGLENDDSDGLGYAIWAMHAYGNTGWVKKFLDVSNDSIIGARMESIEEFVGYERDSLFLIDHLNSDVTYTQNIWGKLALAHEKTMVFPYTTKRMIDLSFFMQDMNEEKEPKHILREIAREISLPTYIIERRKSSFGTNSANWSGENDLLGPIEHIASRLVTEDLLHRLRESKRESENWIYWNLLNYAVWKRICILGDAPSDIVAELIEHMACHK